jgi:hypothetical protein
LAGAVVGGLLAGYGETRLDVPGCQPPGRILLLAKLSDLGQGIGMFVRLDPDCCEAGLDVFAQTLG